MCQTWEGKCLSVISITSLLMNESVDLKDSSMCKLLSCLFIVPLLVSQYTSWLISVNTLLLTKYAIKIVSISRMQVITALIMGWLVSCAITIPYVVIRNNQSSSMCIFSYDDSFCRYN